MHSDNSQTSNQTMSKERKPRSFAPVCHYCKKPGHVMSDCWLFKKRREKEATANPAGIQVPIKQNIVLVKTSLRLLGNS